MGLSSDYPDVPDWQYKDTGYNQTGEKVKYKGNIFYAAFWASEPGVGDPKDNGWRFYDELYDQTPHTPTAQAKVIAYVPTWHKNKGFNYANPELYQYITHAVIAFLTFREANLGEFDPASVNEVQAVLPDVVSTAHACGTLVLIALGGADDYGFLALMTAVGNNAAHPLLDGAVQSVARFVQANGLDGVDLDLECWWGKPGEQDHGGRKKQEGAHPAGLALGHFAQKLKSALPDKLVSATLFGTSWYGNNYDPALGALADHVDWLAIMTYDLTGSWNESPVGPHSALYKIRNPDAYVREQQGEWPRIRNLPPGANNNPIENNPILSVEETMWYWTNPLFVNWQGAGQKVPRNKVAAGVPLYGYDFAYAKGPDDNSGLVPPGYKTLTYKEIVTDKDFPDAHAAPNGHITVPGQTPRPPFVAAPGAYPYANNIYFETPEMAVAKLDFLKSVGAQGVIVWEISGDVWDDQKSILKALYRNSGNPGRRPALAVSKAGTSQPDVFKVPGGEKWPSAFILVHGYATRRIQRDAENGKGKEEDFWYWKGQYSGGNKDNKGSYDVPQALLDAARADNMKVEVVAANWDGRSEIKPSVEEYLIKVLNRHCTGSNTCDLVGHSTGDALIGYALDKYQNKYHWNIRHVFVAGGAGGGTEAATWQDNGNPFRIGFDPVVAQLVPTVMRNLYDHNMHGLYKDVPNIRFVGAGTDYDLTNGIPYPAASGFIRGQSDGLVPFHSQGGVSEHVGSLYNQAYDAYCIRSHTGVAYSCGQLNLGDSPASRWEYLGYKDVKLFDGFHVQMIDNARLYNHTDEVGRLAEWIIGYLRPFPGVPPPFYSDPGDVFGDRPPIPVDPSPYWIQSVLSKKFLNISGASRDPRASIIQWGNPHDPNSQWSFRPTSNEGVFKIVSAFSDLALKVKENSYEIIQDHDGTDWWLDPSPGAGQWKIRNSNNKVLNVQGGSSDDGAPIIQYDDNGDTGNLWTLWLVGLGVWDRSGDIPNTVPSPIAGPSSPVKT